MWCGEHARIAAVSRPMARSRLSNAACAPTTSGVRLARPSCATTRTSSSAIGSVLDARRTSVSAKSLATVQFVRRQDHALSGASGASHSRQPAANAASPAIHSHGPHQAPPAPRHAPAVQTSSTRTSSSIRNTVLCQRSCSSSARRWTTRSASPLGNASGTRQAFASVAARSPCPRCRSSASSGGARPSRRTRSPAAESGEAAPAAASPTRSRCSVAAPCSAWSQRSVRVCCCSAMAVSRQPPGSSLPSRSGASASSTSCSAPSQSTGTSSGASAHAGGATARTTATTSAARALNALVR